MMDWPVLACWVAAIVAGLVIDAWVAWTIVVAW